MSACNNPRQNCGVEKCRRDMMRPEMPCERRNHDMRMKDRKSLAMAYVPWQEWSNLYQPDEGMENGTIFRDLNMPFTGKGMC